MKNCLYVLVLVMHCQGYAFAQILPKSWKNGEIAQALQKEIANLNSEVVLYLETGNSYHLKMLLSDPLKNKIGDESAKWMQEMTPAFQGATLNKFEEFYIEAGFSNTQVNIRSGVGDYSYQYDFIAGTLKNYISLLVVEHPTHSEMLTVGYGNFDGKWKINILELDNYKVQKKTAPDFYKRALALMKDDDLIDAANTIWVAKGCLQPGTYFKYTNNDEIIALYDKLVSESKAKYQLPITVNSVATQPLIFDVSVMPVEADIYPVINYKSTINLLDTAETRKENTAIQKSIGQIFKGIDKNNDHIIYNVYNEIPDGSKRVTHFGFVQTTK